MSLIEYRRTLNRSLAQYNHYSSQVEEEKVHLKTAEERVEHVQTAQKIIQQVAETIQQQAHKRIASVVTRCLKTVFGDDGYDFSIIFEQKRGRTEARLVFIREGQEIEPTEAAGGGVVDVAALALRLSCLILSQPRKRRLLVLDEPLKMLSLDYIPVVRNMLMTLAKEMNVQFVIVTHCQGLQVGKIIRLGE